MPKPLLLILIINIVLICRCVVYKPSLQFDENKKYILLTFDDGPNDHKNTTRQVLEVLEKHKVKALFNLIGTNIDRYPGITREIYNNGHIIANHGYTVMPALFRSRKKIEWEVDSCTSALQKALNDSLFRPLYYRPSMGWYNRRTMKIIRERNMGVNGITVYAVDTKKSAKNTDKIINEIVNKAEKHNGGVVVLHDGIASYKWLEHRLKQGRQSYDRSFIPVVADSIIAILKRKGFSFPVLDENSPNDLSEEELIFFKDIVYF